MYQLRGPITYQDLIWEIAELLVNVTIIVKITQTPPLVLDLVLPNQDQVIQTPTDLLVEMNRKQLVRQAVEHV